MRQSDLFSKVKVHPAQPPVDHPPMEWSSDSEETPKTRSAAAGAGIEPNNSSRAVSPEPQPEGFAASQTHNLVSVEAKEDGPSPKLEAKSTVDDENDNKKRFKKRPPDNRFHQQQMHFCRPIITPGVWIGIFLATGIVCVLISIPIFAAMSHAVDYKVVYGGTQQDGVLDLTEDEMKAHATYWVDCSDRPTTTPDPSPTTIPSTAAPSTAAPSTAAPSTAAPSTAAPSTAAPSTAAPSTAAPSTAAPSTAAPSSTTARRRLKVQSLANAPAQCNITFTIGQDLPTPVYVYFQLEKFYQNYRTYSKSRNDVELGGADVDFKTRASTCANHLFVKDKGENDFELRARADDCDDGRAAPDSDRCRHYSPCGLYARSFFTDRFALLEPAGAVMDEDNIANYFDRIRFRNREGWDQVNPNATIDLVTEYGDILSRGVEDPHFQVWSRLAATSDFRKLYGIITKPGTLKKGTKLTFSVDATFNVTGFDGHKAIALSTTSMFGGYNPALAPLFLATGLIYVVVGLILLFGAIKRQKNARRNRKIVTFANPKQT